MVKTFQASIDQLHAMLQWIREQLSPMNFDSKTLHKIELSSEEALVNIVVHAYQDRPETIEIEVKTDPHSHAEIIIKDKGPPFDPLQQESVDTTSPLEKRSLGGLGIHLMRQYMDDIHYRREANVNVLTLIKKRQ